MKCERCGRDIPIRNMRGHYAACVKMPRPQALAQEWLDGATYRDLAARYGVSDMTVRAAVLNAGITRAQTAARQSRNSGDWIQDGVCTRCGIRLDIPEARPVREGLCGVCAGARPKRRPFSLDDACAVVVAERIV